MVYSACKICNSEVEQFLQEFDLLRCSGCGSIFYKCPFTASFPEELYHKLYNELEDYSAYKLQSQLLQAGIQPPLGYNKRKVLQILSGKGCNDYLEIGAGVGVVGFFLQKKKFTYYGLELDKEAASLACTAGINVRQASFYELRDFKEKDAIIAFEVLEHIDELKQCMEFIYSSLKEGGYIGFTVPNFHNFHNQSISQQQKGLGQVGPPVHINFFTVENIKNILALFDFKVIHLRARPFPSINWRNKSTYKKLLKSFLGEYHGSTILCVAQKKSVIRKLDMSQ